MLTVTTENFDSLLAQSDIVLVQFHAQWCKPCKALTPILESLSEEFKERVIFASIDVDENPEISLRYSVRGVPFLMVFHGEQVMLTHTGSAQKSLIRSFIEGVINRIHGPDTPVTE